MEKINLKKRIYLGILVFSVFLSLSVSFLSVFIGENEKGENPLVYWHETGQPATEVLGESEEGSADESELKGEKYQIKSLVLGTNFGMEIAEIEKASELKIEKIKGELYKPKDGSDQKGVDMVVSCQTNRGALMEVVYSKNGETEGKTEKEELYGKSHHLSLIGLDPDSVYKYQLKVVDESGQLVESEQFVFYTGAPDVSLMDVLENATKKVFGWALGG